MPPKKASNSSTAADDSPRPTSGSGKQGPRLRAGLDGDPRLEELRREYKAYAPGMGTEIYRQVTRATFKLATESATAPQAASQDKDDLLQEFMVQRLLGDSQLAFAMTAARDISHFDNLMRHQFSLWVAKNRERSIVGNLVDRSDKRVPHDPFQVIRYKMRRTHDKASGQRVASTRFAAFGFAGDEVEDRDSTPRELAIAVRDARIVPIRFSATSVDIAPDGEDKKKRLSAVYSREGLADVLFAVCNALRCVRRESLREIFNVMLKDLWATIVYDEAVVAGLVDASLAPAEEIIVRESAIAFVGGLTERQKWVVGALIGGQVKDDALANRLSVTRQTIISDRQRALDSAAQWIDKPDYQVARAFLDTVCEKLGGACGDLDEGCTDAI